MVLLTLYDPRTGVPLAMVDATEITERRTGAVTASVRGTWPGATRRGAGHIGARGTA